MKTMRSLKRHAVGATMAALGVAFEQSNPIETYKSDVRYACSLEGDREMRKGNYQSALKYYKKYESGQVPPLEVEAGAYMLRAAEFSHLSLKQNAIEDYKNALSCSNEIRTKHLCIDKILQLTDQSDILEACLTYQDQYGGTYYKLADYYEGIGDAQQAINCCTTYLEKKNEDTVNTSLSFQAKVLKKRAINYLKLHQIFEAESDIKQALEVVGDGNQELKENLIAFQQEIEEERPIWLFNEYLAVINQEKTLDLSVVKNMFSNVRSVVDFKFPYTLSNILKNNESEFSKKLAVDKLIITNLEELAKNYIKGPKIYAIFVDVILASALNKGIITPIRRTELAKIADNTETFNDPEFLALKEKVKSIEIQVKNNTKNIQILADNINILAQNITSLQHAFQKKAQMDSYLGIARVALSLVGGQVFDLVFAHIADLSSEIEVGAALLNISLDAPPDQLINAIVNHKARIVSASIDQSLRTLGLDPDKFFDTWSKATITLHSPTANNRSSTSSFINSDSNQQEGASSTSSIKGKQKLRIPSPNTSSSTFFQAATSSQCPDFKAWILELSKSGKFIVNTSATEVTIAYSNPFKTEKEHEDILFELVEKWKASPEAETIRMKGEDMKNNTISFSTYSNLDAKRLERCLAKFGLSQESKPPVIHRPK